MSEPKDGRPSKPPRLTYKKNRFAVELVKTGEPKVAAGRAYPNANPTTQRNLAGRLIHDPSVQSKVDKLLAEKYPDHEQAFTKLLERATELATQSEKLTPEAIKLLEFFAKIKGYNSPTKHTTLRATAKLPSE